MADTVSQTVLFPDLFDKPLVAADGGAVLLKAAERQYGLIDGFHPAWRRCSSVEYGLYASASRLANRVP